MTRQVMQAGRLTVTALVGPNRAQMIELDVLPDYAGRNDPARLNRQEVKRLTAALQRWLEQTDPTA